MSIPVNDNLDEIYGGMDVGEYERPKSLQKKFESFGEKSRDTILDFFGQGAKGLVSSVAGAYGDVGSALGINPEEWEQTPGQESRLNRESDVLDKFSQAGYKPTVSDIASLQDDDYAPNFSRIPTSQGIRETIEDFGGPGPEPRTAAGGYAKRASEIYGGGLAFGQINPAPALKAGAAGEAAKHLGVGPLGQAVSEIVTLLATQGKSGALSSNKAKIQSLIDDLKKLGYSEQDITLAVNAAKTGSKQVKGATPTRASEKAFESTAAKSEGLFNEVLEGAFPGISKGTDHLHQVASEAYGQVAKAAKSVKVTDPSRFQKTVDNVTKRLRNTLGENEAAKPFLKRLEDASIAAQHNPNADTYINFYKELNALGKWMNPKEKESLITHVKNGIKSSFRNSGPEGRELSKNFETVNKGVQKAYQAEAVADLLSKGQTAEGIDWNKTLKLFDKQSNWDVLQKGLGTQQTNNLRQIAKVGKEVGDFRSSLGSMQKGGKLSGWISKAKGGAFLYALSNGHYKTAAGLLAASGGKAAYGRLQTRLLTDPKFQNVMIKSMNAIKTNSPQALQRASQEMKTIASEEGIDVDSF